MTAVGRSRHERGRKTQRLVADYMIDVWPDGVSVEAFKGGVDILNTPGWAVEVKGTRDGTLTGAMKQADGYRTDELVPVVIWRPDGYGEERIGQWVVAMRLHDFKDLVRDVGRIDRSLGR